MKWLARLFRRKPAAPAPDAFAEFRMRAEQARAEAAEMQVARMRELMAANREFATMTSTQPETYGKRAATVRMRANEPPHRMAASPAPQRATCLAAEHSAPYASSPAIDPVLAYALFARSDSPESDTASAPCAAPSFRSGGSGDYGGGGASGSWDSGSSSSDSSSSSPSSD